MSDDLPPGLIPALLFSQNGILMLVLAILLSAATGLIMQALIVGVQARSLQRPAAWRSLQAAMVNLTLATVCWSFFLQSYSSALWYGAHGSESRFLYTALFGTWGDAFLLAFSSALIVALVIGISGSFSPRRGSMGWSVALGYGIAKLLTPWGAIGKRNGGRNGEETPDFEITMASGEQVEDAERELIENILEMGDTTVREVMKPRPDVAALDVAWPADRIMAEVAGARFSRFPVYEDTIDNVIGVLHLRDLFEFLARGDGTENFTLRELLMEPLFMPESKKVDDALRDLQKHKSHMAVVLDEYGGTAGIVTIEDLLEEIVGEIQDEYDDESKLVHQREDGSYVVTAQLPLDDLAELLELPLESEDVDTVGGYIVDAMGRIPAVQDVLEHDGLRFTILSVEKNRIGRVKVERA